jgi:hypothetical protein
MDLLHNKKSHGFWRQPRHENVGVAVKFQHVASNTCNSCDRSEIRGYYGSFDPVAKTVTIRFVQNPILVQAVGL